MTINHGTIAHAVFLVTILVCGLGASTVLGQNAANSEGVPGLLGQALAKLAQLGHAVGVLQDSVDRVQDTLDKPAEPEANFRLTPAINLVTGGVYCQVSNASDTAKSVHVQMFDASGIVKVENTYNLGAGTTVSLGAGTGVLTGLALCKFTVLDGTRADIRGSISLAAPLLSSNTLLALPAE